MTVYAGHATETPWRVHLGRTRCRPEFGRRFGGTKFAKAHFMLKWAGSMATHLPHPESPAERLARYRQLSEEARKSAINASDTEITRGFLRLVVEWDELAEKARTELNAASVPPLWG